MMNRICAVVLVFGSAEALADVRVAFDERAPKDRFSITNVGDCPVHRMDLVIDLGASPAGLVFDVTAQGAGVQVYQPFEVVAGAEFLRGVPVVTDGQSVVTLAIDQLGADQQIVFTVDIDDTSSASQTIVSDLEMGGALVRLGEAEASFAQTSVALVRHAGCNA